MTRTETVTVYNFHETATQLAGGIPSLAPYKATRALISSLGGELLEGTQEEIPIESMGPGGRYQRVATGWGAHA